MQKINFVEIPNIRPKDYFLSLRQIYNHIISHAPAYKVFRQWMREKGWWEKEKADELMQMLGLNAANPVGMQPFAQEIAKETDEDKGKEIIGRRLIKINPLLAKYCLEAMDVENDGRIQSTRELFKLIDSFVYPGTKPTLTAFNAWMEWAEAGGLVRLIGIRWGLSAFAKENLPHLRAIDADEFLEDEEVEQDTEAVTYSQPTKTTQETPVPNEAREIESKENKNSGSENPDMQTFTPTITPVPVQNPAGPAFYMVFPTPLQDKASLKKTAHAILDWWTHYPAKQVLNFGVLGGLAQSQTVKLQAFYVALGMGRGHEFNKVMMTAGSLRAAGVFESLTKGRSPLPGIKKAYRGAWDIETAALIESAAAMAAMAQAIKGFRFDAFDTPDALLDALDRDIFHGIGGLAAFVAARIALNAGILKENMQSTGFIPFFAVRQQAFRMGFIDRIYCNNFDELKQIGIKLASYFGSDASLEQALLHLPGAFGCAFNCGRQANCPFLCREKITYNV